jgi:hypothetical protein
MVTVRIQNHVQYDTHTNLYVGQHKEMWNVKLRPKLKINGWPRYGLMNTCIITGNCRFRKIVVYCGKWPVYKGGQHRNFHSISSRWIAFSRPDYFASGGAYGTHYTGSWAGLWNCVNLVAKKNARSVFSGILRHGYQSAPRNSPENMDILFFLRQLHTVSGIHSVGIYLPIDTA